MPRMGSWELSPCRGCTHCKGLGDQTLPEIEPSVCPDCLEKGPGCLSFACPVRGR